MENRLITALLVMLFLHQNLDADTTPTMSRIYGNQFTPQIGATQDAGAIGTLVPTGIFGTNGTLSLASQVPNAQAVATQVLDNGIIIVTFSDGTNTYVVQYTQDGDIYTQFAAGTGNILTLAGCADPTNFITVDAQGRLMLTGKNGPGHVPWMQRVLSDGTIDASFNFTDSLSWTSFGQINQIMIQTTGKMIAVGFNGTNAMLARYNLDGSIDVSFGNLGYTILNGSVSGGGITPTSPYASASILIDMSNNIYVAYLDASPSVYVIRLTPVGLVDTTWHSGAGLYLNYLDGLSMQTDQLFITFDAVGNLIAGITSGEPTVIKVTSVNILSASTPGTFANFSTSGGVFGSDDYALCNLMATSDGSVYLLGSNLTSKKMAIVRCSSTGILDTTFNNTGVNFFYPTGFEPNIYSLVFSGAIAPDGQIFLAGAELNLGITTAYLSSLYNNQYVHAVPEFPAVQEQGTLDGSFGPDATAVYKGIVSPFVGLYRANLQQKAESVIELASGCILAGMNGFLGTNPVVSNMVLVRLTSQGSLDGSFGQGGTFILPNITGTNEYITSILEDGFNNLYVTGYSDQGAIFRKYDSSGSLLWNSDYLVSGYQGQSCGFQGQTRILLFLSGPGHSGQINAYIEIDGSVDTDFNSISGHPGQLWSTDYGLDMGSLYSGIIDDQGNVYVGYKNNRTDAIDVTALVNLGTAVLWTASDVFTSTTIDTDNVRVSFNAQGNIAVTAALNSEFLVTVLDAATGIPTSLYTTPLVIVCGTSVQVRQLIGVSDNSLLLIGYDADSDGMLVARVGANGRIDTSFDSQGSQPGVAVIAIGNQIPNYYARVGSGIAVQSQPGAHQGDIIMSGYEQLFSHDATPMIMRLFGAPGTTQVPNSPKYAHIPGTFDTTYGTDGVAFTYALGASTPAANQQVRSIRQLVGSQIITVINDNTTSIAYLQRLHADSSIDTTFSQDGNGIAIVNMPGVEMVQSLVFDGVGNFLITGFNSINGGFIKRMLPNGLADQTFGGLSGAPLGTAYGLMDTVNACQQLTNGQIVIGGSKGGIGMIQMLSASGALISSFGVSGQLNYGMNVTSVSVDPSNNIYACYAYQNAAHIDAGIVKINSTGQTVSFVVQPALVNIDSSSALRLVFDDQYCPVVAASVGGVSGQLVITRYTADGQIDTTFNDGSALYISFADQVPSANVAVTGLVALQNNKIMVSGYLQNQTMPAYNYEYIACVMPTGQLDGSFGDGSTPGLVIFQILADQQARTLTDLNVQTDGKILMCGGEQPISPANEQTPITLRMNGYPNIQSVPQYTGYNAVIPSPLNPEFNGTGIAYTAVSDLDQVGNIIIDGSQRPLVGGVTSTGFFKIAHYVRSGLLDLDFGTAGIATTPVAIEGLTGGYLALDGDGKILMGGINAAHQFVIAKFTNLGNLDTSFAGGVVTSSVIPNLQSGGSITANIITDADFVNYPVIAGYTSDGNLVAVRFSSNGIQDTNFGVSGVATIPVSNLVQGGAIICDITSAIYLGAITTDQQMVVAKIDKHGVLISGYGAAGYAQSGVIANNIIDGGSIDLDGNNNIVIGGLTGNKSFVVARFTPFGNLDELFDGGLAYSLPVDSMTLFGNIGVDNMNRVICGGVAANYDNSKSMIVARFTPTGILDTVLSSSGMATTGPLTGLLSGGVVIADTYADIFSAGLTDAAEFVVTEMYGGEQIFVNDPAILNPQDLKTYYYGNNADHLIRVLSADIFSIIIADTTVRTATLIAVLAIVADFVALYADQPGFNLVWSLYRFNDRFAIARILLANTYPSSSDDIGSFFNLLNSRISGMKYSS